MSKVIGDLNDNCFTMATELLVALCREVEQEAGAKPSLDDLCELLSWGLRSCSADILSDVDPSDVVSLKPKLRASRSIVKSLTPGDLVAVPSAKGGYHLIVFIVSNRVGWGFGILKGLYPLRPPVFETQPQIVMPPFYTHHEQIKTGNWPVGWTRSRVAKAFPSRARGLLRK